MIFSDGFSRCVGIRIEKHQLLVTCPSGRIYARLLLDGFARNLVLGLLRKSVEKFKIILKSHKSGTLREGLLVLNVSGSDTQSATIQRTHCCASVAKLSVFITFLTAKHVRYQYKGNSLLRLHGNNGYARTLQYSFIRTLATFLAVP